MNFDHAPKIQFFHFHIYYAQDTYDTAKLLANAVVQRFKVDMGRMHEKPVGPHPMWSVQLTVPLQQFSDVLTYMATNRQELTVFVHPVTGDDLADHTEYVIWLGDSKELKIQIFA